MEIQGQPPQTGAGGTPKVSIVMPTYCVAEYIGDALRSIFAQTMNDYEILVVNDGSPDTEELERVLEPYLDRIVYIKLPENRGISCARNAGIWASRGRYIALLDPDDLWEPNYLEVQVGMLERNPAISVLYSDAIIFGNVREQNRTFMQLFPSEGEVTFESLLSRKCNVMISVTATREAIVGAGMFDESLRSCEDFDLWLRIVKRGCAIAYHDQPLVHYRRRPGALSSDPVWMCQQALKVFDKVGKTAHMLPHENAVWLRERSKFLAQLRLYEGKRAFFNGDVKEAIAKIADANAILASRKLSLVIRLLQLAPGTLRWAYRIRDRFVFNSETRF